MRLSCKTLCYPGLLVTFMKIKIVYALHLMVIFRQVSKMASLSSLLDEIWVSWAFVCLTEHSLNHVTICCEWSPGHLTHIFEVNSFWPSDAIWQHRSGSILAQVMTWCCQAPSHYLNQCWLIIYGVLWYSPYSNFTGSTWYISSWYEFENYNFQITATSPRGQWVNMNDTVTVIRFSGKNYEFAIPEESEIVLKFYSFH